MATPKDSTAAKTARPTAKAQAASRAKPATKTTSKPKPKAALSPPAPPKRRAPRAAEPSAQAAPPTHDATRPRGASEIFGTVPFPLKRHHSPHGQVTAVSMMKDEGPYVLEWVAHHLAIGFTDLVVYTNDCSDGTDDMLIRLEELGLAHHRRNRIPEGIRPQPSALNHAQAEPVVGLSDWVLVFDADEFVSIRYGDGSLDQLIAAVKEAGANGVVLTWRIFGSGGVVEWSRAPVTEQYLKAAPPEWNKGWGVKTLFAFDPAYWKLGIHRPKMKTKWIKTDFPDQVHWLNGSGRVMEDYFKFRGWRSIVRTVGYDWAQLNHYAIKSVDSYALRKLRGNVNNKADKYNSDYWALQDRNETDDPTMLRYSAVRARIFAQLLEDPVLNRLHFAALERVEARLSEIRATEAYTDLLRDLAQASAIPIHQITAKPPQARDPQKIAALMSQVEKDRGAKAREARKSTPREPVDSVPLSPFVSAPTTDLDFTGPWHENHKIWLPADPRLFTTPALSVIALGKFERGLARRLPHTIAQGAHVLEIGANIGFLARHLAAARPDLRQTLIEPDPAFRRAMALLDVKNAPLTSARCHFEHEITALESSPQHLPRLAPEALILGTPQITPALLAALLAQHRPKQVFLYGRLMTEARATLYDLSQILGADFDLVAGFDPNLTLQWHEKSASPP